MAMLGTFPFVPNMDDCKMVVQADGAVCYIMDTCCRNMTPEVKAQADQEIVDIYMRSAMRRKMKGSA
ncbi:hypothetical protein QVN85_01855 [Oscillibacter valericigenes]|uniref:hypothetical protein n=1 Tax=Oscillibacter ruminantium TaxID=1263547 RepID=UPI0002EC9A84|nr:hypothetical protein [Oscillibacter ruminantium]MDN0031638.1 hypothetical protein [Oscillibacter valericigenes]